METYLQQGAIIADRYRIVGPIGRGGMGEVYAAEDLRLNGKLRAVKVNRPLSADGYIRADEAAMLMRLDNPRLPSIVDYCPPDAVGVEIVVMDYIDGQTLQKCMERAGERFPADAVIQIGLQLSEALSYLHSQHPPIIHRDLKPTNVMLDRSGDVRLIDFGIARSYKEGAQRDTSILGTPGFAAPEQNGKAQSDVRTDIYGLGALMYYLLSGGHPPLTRRPLSEDVPVDLRSIIYRMLEQRPKDRFASMNDVAAALVHVKTRISSTPERQQRIREAGVKSINTRHSARHVIVASLAPGSGSTFVAITLAMLLAEQGIRCSAMEHPLVSPEWHALLPGANLRQHKAADSRFQRFEAADVLWHALHAQQQEEFSAAGMKKLALMLEQLSSQVHITDLSHHWTKKEVQEQLLAAHHVVFVADPFPSKWTAHRLAAAERLQYERDAAGLSTDWVLNKDVPFSGRKEWFSLLPRRPVIAVPQLPPDRWVHVLWEGKWLTADRRMKALMKEAFQPLVNMLFA